MQFKKDLLKVFSSNIVSLIIGIVTGFIIPTFLSLDQYAYLKTFSLYLTYVGVLHFGFIDGLFIKYGGKQKSELDIGRLKGEHKFLIFLQLLVTLFSLLLGIILKDMILIAFSVTILPINIQTLFRFFYQALGEFNIYSKLMLLTPNLLLIFNLFIIFVLKINNYWPFALASIATYYLVFIGLEVYFLIKYRGIKPIIDITEILGHFKVGVFIMIGNFSSVFFFASDRWFVKFALTVKDFAFYSFAISMLGVINVLINSVTMTFYPYLARSDNNNNKIKDVKIYLLIIGVFASGGYFVFDFIVSVYLKKYVPSLDIISILFAGYPAIIIINALYKNLYKVKRQEKKYVYAVVLICIASVLLNVVALIIIKSNYSIAIATTISYYFWYLYSAKDFALLKHNRKEMVFLVLFLVIFFMCGNYFNWLFGGIIYLILILLLTYFLYKKDLTMLIREALKRTTN